MQREKNWGRYFAEEMKQEPKSPWGMVALSLRLVLKTFAFLTFIIVKIIGGTIMGLRGKLRKKKKAEELKPFAFNPQHEQQMMAQQQYQPMPQQPVPQQPMPQQPMQQPLNVPMQPVSYMEKLPVAAPVYDPIHIQMLNEVYGAIGFIRQALVDTHSIVRDISAAINDIYQRLNAIEGIQPVPVEGRAGRKIRK